MSQYQPNSDPLLNRLRGGFVYSVLQVTLPANPSNVKIADSDPSRVFIEFYPTQSGSLVTVWPNKSSFANGIVIFGQNSIPVVFNIDTTPGLVQDSWFGAGSGVPTAITIVQVFSTKLG